MSLANGVGNNLNYFDALDLLPLRGFAGSLVANPGTDPDSGFFVDGEYASGAHAAAEWLESKIAIPPDSAMRYMLFLVGAPGNGKSHIASQIQRGLQEIGPHRSSNIHHRMHEYQHGSGQQLTIINDATIPPHSNGGAMDRSALINDIEVVSKPGKRVYSNCDKIPVVSNGLGVVVLSTSKGVITDKEARKLNVGGEVLCYVY